MLTCSTDYAISRIFTAASSYTNPVTGEQDRSEVEIAMKMLGINNAAPADEIQFSDVYLEPDSHIRFRAYDRPDGEYLLHITGGRNAVICHNGVEYRTDGEELLLPLNSEGFAIWAEIYLYDLTPFQDKLDEMFKSFDIGTVVAEHSNLGIREFLYKNQTGKYTLASTCKTYSFSQYEGTLGITEGGRSFDMAVYPLAVSTAKKWARIHVDDDTYNAIFG